MSEETKKAPIDLENLFDNIIKDGFKSKEKEIVPGFKVKLRPLSYNELVKAEAEISRRNPDIPADVTVKLRCGKILAAAIISINGVLIEDDSDTIEGNTARRTYLYDKLVTGPAVILQDTYVYYINTVAEEEAFYRNDKETVEAVENF